MFVRDMTAPSALVTLPGVRRAGLPGSKTPSSSIRANPLERRGRKAVGPNGKAYGRQATEGMNWAKGPSVPGRRSRRPPDPGIRVTPNTGSACVGSLCLFKYSKNQKTIRIRISIMITIKAKRLIVFPNPNHNPNRNRILFLNQP